MFYAYAALGDTARRFIVTSRYARRGEGAAQTPLGPSRGTVYKLAALFSIDAFAGGFVAQSLLVLWLFERFDLSLGGRAVLLLVEHAQRLLLSGRGLDLQAHRARQHHGVHAYSLQHLPDPGGVHAPNSSGAGLLLLRSALSQMDVPTRTSYVMAVVTPAERPAAASVTAVPRSLASAISPAISGAL